MARYATLEDQIAAMRQELQTELEDTSSNLMVPAWGILGFIALGLFGIPGVVAASLGAIGHATKDVKDWRRKKNALDDDEWFHVLKGDKRKQIKKLIGEDNYALAKAGNYSFYKPSQPVFALPQAETPEPVDSHVAASPNGQSYNLPSADFFKTGFTSGYRDSGYDLAETVEPSAENFDDVPFDMPVDESINLKKNDEPVDESIEEVNPKTSHGYEFDLTDLANVDDHPIIAVVAPRRAGKTTLIRYLAKSVCMDYSATGMAFDKVGASWEWGKLRLIGDYEQMVIELGYSLIEIEARSLRWQHRIMGQSTSEMFSKDLLVFDEWHSTLVALKKIKKLSCEIPIALDRLFQRLPIHNIINRWFSELDSVAAKVNTQVIFGATGIKALGFDPENRKNITLIFPGVSGIDFAFSDTEFLKLGTIKNEHLRNQLQAELDDYSRAALVYHNGKWAIAEIPELNESGELETQFSYQDDQWEETYQMAIDTTDDETLIDTLEYIKGYRGQEIDCNDPELIETLEEICALHLMDDRGSGRFFVR